MAQPRGMPEGKNNPKTPPGGHRGTGWGRCCAVPWGPFPSPSPRPPLHLQPELPGALLDLVLRLHVEHLGRALPVDGDDDIPRAEVAGGRLPLLHHLRGEGDTGTKPPGSEPPSSGAAAPRPSCASVAKVTALQGWPRPQIHPKSTQIRPQIPFTHSLPSPLDFPKQHQPRCGVQRTRTDGPPAAPTQPVWGRRPFPQSANPRGGQTGSCSSRAAPLSTRPAPQPGGELLPWRR